LRSMSVLLVLLGDNMSNAPEKTTIVYTPRTRQQGSATARSDPHPRRGRLLCLHLRRSGPGIARTDAHGLVRHAGDQAVNEDYLDERIFDWEPDWQPRPIAGKGASLGQQGRNMHEDGGGTADEDNSGIEVDENDHGDHDDDDDDGDGPTEVLVRTLLLARTLACPHLVRKVRARRLR
jgi:hypothetical protein